METIYHADASRKATDSIPAGNSWQFWTMNVLIMYCYDLTLKDVWGESKIIHVEFLDALWFKI